MIPSSMKCPKKRIIKKEEEKSELNVYGEKKKYYRTYGVVDGPSFQITQSFEYWVYPGVYSVTSYDLKYVPVFHYKSTNTGYRTFRATWLKTFSRTYFITVVILDDGITEFWMTDLAWQFHQTCLVVAAVGSSQ